MTLHDLITLMILPIGTSVTNEIHSEVINTLTGMSLAIGMLFVTRFI